MAATKAKKKEPAPARRASAKSSDVNDMLAWLRAKGTKSHRDGLARYGIVAPKAFGVPVGVLRAQAKKLGPDHDLALALWKSDWYEARMLATMVDDPARVTPAQMDRWCRDFDNWAICDTACFALFDRSPHAWSRLAPWARREPEFERRAAFALLASLAAHDKAAPDAAFVRALALVTRGARDERNFVKKGVSWALRAIGHRNSKLHEAAVALARKLADSAESPARWVGNDTLRDLLRPAVAKKLAARGQAKGRTAR